MSEILSVEEAERAALHERCAQLWESHEALRARLAEVEAERDNLAMFRRDWYANDLPEMQRLAMWLDPDPDLPLPSLHNLVSGAMEREAEVAARLAEVEQALRKYGEHLGSCSYATDHFGIGGRKKADCRPCSCGFAAVLDKGEQG